MTENEYQAKLIKKLRRAFPGCVIIRPDFGYQQGIPDLLLLFRHRWAALEVKVDAAARMQPNQRHFVELLHDMSYSSFIYPENEEVVIQELVHIFEGESQ